MDDKEFGKEAKKFDTEFERLRQEGEKEVSWSVMKRVVMGPCLGDMRVVTESSPIEIEKQTSQAAIDLGLVHRDLNEWEILLRQYRQAGIDLFWARDGYIGKDEAWKTLTEYNKRMKDIQFRLTQRAQRLHKTTGRMLARISKGTAKQRKAILREFMRAELLCRGFNERYPRGDYIASQIKLHDDDREVATAMRTVDAYRSRRVNEEHK